MMIRLDWNGLLSEVTNGSGFVVEYMHDIMDRVTNISWRTTSGAAIGGFQYECDAVGRIVSRSHVLGDPSHPSQMSQMSQLSQKNYAYDDLDRLASDGGVTYTYDAAGNRMTRTEDGETITYTLGVGQARGLDRRRLHIRCAPTGSPDCHRYAKQSSAELIAEGAIS